MKNLSEEYKKSLRTLFDGNPKNYPKKSRFLKKLESGK